MIDRQLQYKILKELSEVYPNSVNYSDRYDYDSEEYQKLTANMYYLIQHQLVSKDGVLESRSMNGSTFQLNLPSITHKGLDFLEDDGGLSAILGVVTVKFESEQLTQILESKISQSDLDPERKKSMITALRELSGESIKHLTTKILDKGWDSLPALMNVIQTFLE